MTAPTPPKADALSPLRAEVISELWQAVSYIEEVRAKLTAHVRTSEAREAASRAMTEATTRLVVAAQLLLPSDRRRETIELHTEGKERSP